MKVSDAPKLEEKYVYKDYLNWPDDERWELIKGIPYNMSPAPSRLHQEILVNLIRIISNYLEKASCEIYPAPFDVRLQEYGENKETASNVVQPDISVICDISKLDDKGCIGAPDFIVEILSESTASKDMNEKLFLYEKHKVKEYWIVDLWDKTIKAYILENTGKYSLPILYRKTDTIKVHTLQNLNINLNSIFKD